MKTESLFKFDGNYQCSDDLPLLTLPHHVSKTNWIVNIVHVSCCKFWKNHFLDTFPNTLSDDWDLLPLQHSPQTGPTSWDHSRKWALVYRSFGNDIIFVNPRIFKIWCLTFLFACFAIAWPANWSLFSVGKIAKCYDHYNKLCKMRAFLTVLYLSKLLGIA